MEYILGQIPVADGWRTLIGAAAIIIITALTSLILRSVLFAIIGRFTRKTSTTLDDRLLKATRTYITLLVYVFGLSVFFNFLENRYTGYVSDGFIRTIDGIIYGFGVFVVAVLLIKIVSTILEWYSSTIAVKTETALNNEFVPLLERTIKIVTMILAILIVLEHYEVDIKGLVAVLGVGSLAVALAAQDTLANMIGGFTLMIDRPFRVGDMVRLPDNRRVTVYEIGIRSTKFLTFDNTLVVVPNAELIKSTVHNITYPHPRVRVVVDVGVGYGSDIDLVRKVMLDEAGKHHNILTDPKPLFFFMNFGDSSLDVSLRCHVTRAEEHRRTSSELRLQVLKRFRQEGIEIPFPQRVVTMVKEEREVG